MKKNYADMDPIEEIRAIRAEIMREFKTLDAYCEYLEGKYPAKTAPRKTTHRNQANTGSRLASRRCKRMVKA